MNKKYNTTEFEVALSKLGLEMSEIQRDQFLLYYEMLIEKNKVMNLTAITEFDEVWLKHFVDSLALCQVRDLSEEQTVLDLGTGAGFPGIPLKIMFPNLRITLMDSLNKRIHFLNEVIDALQLDGIEAVHERAEMGARNKSYRENFDLCVSRAVANISTLSEYCLPFVAEGGQFISYKSGNIDEELDGKEKVIQKLGGELSDVFHFQLADTDQSRSFVVIDKIAKTPKTYPRKAGLPSKEPLQ